MGMPNDIVATKVTSSRHVGRLIENLAVVCTNDIVVSKCEKRDSRIERVCARLYAGGVWL